MQQVDLGGPPTPPFRHLRGGSRRKKSFLSAISWSQRLWVLMLITGFCGSIFFLTWWFWPRTAAASPNLPGDAAVATVPPLPTPLPIEIPTAPDDQPTITPTTPLEPAQIAATATFQAAISRPAAYSNPQAAPFFIGVVTYEPGCTVSNIGFTTAGLDGQPYYLFFTAPLDRDPLMQMVNITGYVQEFEGCNHPVLMVQEIFWLSAQATPAPAPLLARGTITATRERLIPWGQQGQPATYPTPYHTSITPMPPGAPAPTNTPTYTGTVAAATATPWTSSNWSPQPWPTVNLSGIQSQIDAIQDDINAYKAATRTPTATHTPTPTATPTTAYANITGDVINIAGCPQTNLAIATAPGEQLLLMLSGAALPNGGQPADYHALASGRLESVCGQTAIFATSVSWILPTLTPTETPTATPPPTETPTATATLEHTEVITQ